MAKYKLRGDYVFFDEKNNPVQNKLGKDNIVIEAVIIDGSKTKVDGQLHKLEEIKEVKKEAKVDKPVVPPSDPEQPAVGPAPESKPEQPAVGEQAPDSALPQTAGKKGK